MAKGLCWLRTVISQLGGTTTRVIFTGQSGLAKGSLIREVKALAEAAGRQVLYFHIGEMMYQASDPPIAPGRILRQDLSKLEGLRDKVFDQISHEIERNPDFDVFVDTHATFRQEHGLFKGFLPSEVLQIKPDFCITLIADVDEIKMRLPNSDYGEDLSLRDIVTWREEEILGSELLSALVEKCTHYVVPRNFESKDLFRLLYDPEVRPCYLSFPITGNIPSTVRSRIDTFRKAFRRLPGLVVFDPLEATDEPTLIGKAKRTLRGKVKVIVDGKLLKIAKREILDIARDILGQTRAFDFRMVGQTKVTVAYVPVYNGKPFRADGVTTELNYATYRGKERYLIWPAKESPSLMLDPDETFKSIEQAVKFFKSET